MSLIMQIDTDLTVAMKARDQVKLDTLRMVRAALKNEQIAQGKELDDIVAGKVLAKLVKQRKEAAEQYQAAGRNETAEKELAEAQVIESYLPKQMSDDELAKIVDDVLAQSGATAQADFGRVMGQVMARTTGQADGSRVSALLKQKLN